ncbi:MAG TPA: TorF family putative porin [Myxococcota bacterium]|nr:TorF family putative porin [Myxococcota bacterium]
MTRLPKVLAAAGLAAALVPAAAAAQESPHSFSGKVALYSEYEFRGLAQTHEDPALQLSLDYGHASGFYVGTFLSNIEWLEKTAQANGFDTDAKLEWDIYAGYRAELAPGWLLDVGYLRYEYPSSGAFSPKPNTDEVYASIGYGMFNVKYSYAFSDAFGFADSEGSDFLEANVAWPAMENLTLTGHVGHQRFKNSGDFDYTVWKVGAVYDFGNGLNAGAYYKGTDAEESLYTVLGKDWSRDRLVAFVSYSF